MWLLGNIGMPKQRTSTGCVPEAGAHEDLCLIYNSLVYRLGLNRRKRVREGLVTGAWKVVPGCVGGHKQEKPLLSAWAFIVLYF